MIVEPGMDKSDEVVRDLESPEEWLKNRKAGDCELCGEWFRNLRNGVCDPCRKKWNIRTL